MSRRAIVSVDGAGESMHRGFLAAAASSAATAFASISSIHFLRVGDVTARLPACRAMILLAHQSLRSLAAVRAVFSLVEAVDERVWRGARESWVARRRRPVPRTFRGRAGLAWRAHETRWTTPPTRRSR